MHAVFYIGLYTNATPEMLPTIFNAREVVPE
jgi:hypothetical protein